MQAGNMKAKTHPALNLQHRLSSATAWATTGPSRTSRAAAWNRKARNSLLRMQTLPGNLYMPGIRCVLCGRGAGLRVIWKLDKQ